MADFALGIFHRTQLLMGEEFMRRMAEVRVVVLGVGGVGSWCAESLVRSGLKHLTLVDNDTVCVTNVNRQLMATTKTVGRPKVDALKERLLEINPDAEIVAVQGVYCQETAEGFRLETYDYIVDAIDSLRDKQQLILHGTRLMKERKGVTFVSSMGAALRTDPFAIRKAEFWEVDGDPLARMLRKRYRQTKEFPSHKFMCVYSCELPRENRGAMAEESMSAGSSTKAKINGTMAHVTIMFGTALAGLVIEGVERSLRAQCADACAPAKDN